MTRIAVIDGDILSYRAAAANEKRTVIALHNETLEQETFSTLTEFRSWLATEGNYTEDQFTLKPVQTPEPVEHALHFLKLQIHNITEKAKCDSYHIVVSGGNNFRLDLPLPTRYKSNRKDSARPLQLKECLEYLVNTHAAEVSEGCEADDILVQYAYAGYKNKEWIVQCSLDKDAKHGPSLVFDWTKDSEPILIEGYGGLENNGKSIKGQGRAFFYFQVLFGDVVDGYKPCQLAKVKFGEISAYNLLKDCNNDREALTVVVNQYKKWYPEPLTYYAWDNQQYTKDWLEIMQMYVDCAHMRRFEGDRVDVKKLLDKLKVEH